MQPTPAPGGAGRFVVFEGPEGAGKTTQVARLAARLRAAGADPVTTREPGGTPAGDRIRGVLLDPGLRVDPATEFLLYAAARAQHVAEVIGPALAAGRTVLSDRFTAASMAYQGYGRGLDRDWIRDVNGRVTAGVRPDLVVLLDLEPGVGPAAHEVVGVDLRPAGVGVVEVDPLVEAVPGERPVRGARVEVGEPEAPSGLTADARLAAAGGAVDGHDQVAHGEPFGE